MASLPYVIKDESRIVEQLVQHDGISFHTITVLPPAQTVVRGKIMIVHGWCEHSGMYHKLMEVLADQGYQVFAFDQRGSGKTSLGKYRGRVGRTKAKVFTDLDRMMEEAWFSDIDEKDPLHILIGHSMGGGIALSYGVRGQYRHRISHIVTTGPLIQLHESLVPPSWLLYVLSTAASWFPNWAVQTMEGPLTVTTLEAWRQYLGLDALCRGIGTLGQLSNMIARGADLHYGDLSTIDPEVKILVLHATNDNVTSLHALQRFVERVKLPAAHKKFVEIEGACHSLFIEEDIVFDRVVQTIQEFI